MKTFNRSRWFVVLGLLSLALLAGVSVSAQEAQEGELAVHAEPSAAENWLHFGYDGAYTSYNPLESRIAITNVAQLKRAWGIGCDDAGFSVISRSPAIHDGTLFTSGAGRKLTAYNARSGELLWQYGSGNYGWAPQPVVSEDGVVFYMEGQSGTYQLYAVAAGSGSQLWQAPLGFDMSFNDTALVTVDEPNGLVYLVETPFIEDGKLYALDKQTGEIAWYKSKATDGVSFEGDYVLIQDGKLFVEAETEQSYWVEDRMLRIDASTQDIEVIFDEPVGNELNDISKYTLCNGKLVTVFCDRDDVFESVGTVVAYDAFSTTSSSVLWQEAYTVTGRIACNTANDTIYVPTDPYLYALDASTGEEVWKYMGYEAIYNPSVANGIVYFLSDTNMYAIDEEARERLFRFPLGYEAYETTQVAIADGMLYFSGNGGTCDLYALGSLTSVYLPLVVRNLAAP